jgi:gluconolactonase
VRGSPGAAPTGLLGGPLPTVETTVIARVAPAPQAAGGVSAWAQLQQRPHCDSFLEGLTVAPDGRMFALDLAWGRVLELLENGETRTLAQYDGQPNGIALTPDGGAVLADFEHGLMRLDRLSPGARVTPLLTRYGMDRFAGLNDVLATSAGELYFGDQGGSGLHAPTGRIYRRTPAGELQLVVDGVPSPNALALDERRRLLFVAVTRDNAIWRIPLRADGTVAKVGRFIQLSGGMGPDGIALTPDGGLLVTHLGLGVVWLFDALGLPVLAYRCPGPDPTSVTVDRAGRVALIAEASTGTILAGALPAATSGSSDSPTKGTR